MKLGTLTTSLLLTMGLALTSTGCNLWGGIDEPTDDNEIIEQALTDMDDGKCTEALKRFQGKTNLSDDGLHTKGWAQLCTNGASLTNVAKSLFSFSSSTDNLAILGSLTNAMLPMDAAKVTGIDEAITTFAQIKDDKVRSTNLTMAKLIKVAAVVGKSAANDGLSGGVKRADIGPCAAACTTCGTGAAGEMSDADANLVGATILSATQTSTTGLGSIGDLAVRMNTLFPNGSAANVYRCQVYLKFFTE